MLHLALCPALYSLPAHELPFLAHSTLGHVLSIAFLAGCDFPSLSPSVTFSLHFFYRQVLREVRRLPAGKKVSDVDGDDNHESESTGEDQGFEERDNDDDDNDDDSLFGSYSRNRRRRAKNTSRESGTSSTAAHEVSEGDDGAGGDAVDTPPADGETVLQGFRRLLWFWEEYYMRGGRDRLSLEFSTHVKFWAWKRVIRLLCADDGSPTSLVAVPLRLPRSPYDTVPPPPPRTT